MKPRCVFVVGTTGVGKTRLGVDLARSLNGEVISADSIQVYKGLDIASAKVTEEESHGVPHHMIDICEVGEEFSAHRFAQLASPVVDHLAGAGKLPVVVGGTFYYLEGLLWQNFLTQQAQTSSSTPDEKLASLSTASLFAKLQQEDPLMANRLHPNNRRKILRSLEVFASTRQRHSELLLESGGLQGKTSELRYDCVVLWLDASPTVLENRLNKRIDKMIQRGLAEELIQVYGLLQRRSEQKDTDSAAESVPLSKGVGQAIGFKEFVPWLQARVADPTDKERLEALWVEGVNQLRTHTRRYATKQVHWIGRRLGYHAQTAGLRLYRLDTSEAEDDTVWQRQVLEPALRICRGLLDGCAPSPGEESILSLSSALSPLSPTPIHSGTNKETICEEKGGAASSSDTPIMHAGDIRVWQKFQCEQCNRLLDGEHAWTLHLAGRKHKNRVRSLKRKAERESSGVGQVANDKKRKQTDSGKESDAHRDPTGDAPAQ